MDEFELPGASDDFEETDAHLDELRDRFEESEWAGREPLDVEVPFETMIADRLIRGRMDAVFQVSEDRYEVVDWKTGRRPDGQEGRSRRLLSSLPPIVSPSPSLTASPWTT